MRPNEPATMTTNKTVGAAELAVPLGTPLTTIPQTIFGTKTLPEGRKIAFQTDISKLVDMTLEDYSTIAAHEEVKGGDTDEGLWLSFK